MFFVVCYLNVMLYVNPYIDPSDDRMHLLALVEIFFLLLTGRVFFKKTELAPFTDTEDFVMTACLVVVFFLLFAAFLWGAIKIARATLKDFLAKRAEKKRRTEKRKLNAAALEAKAFKEDDDAMADKEAWAAKDDKDESGSKDHESANCSLPPLAKPSLPPLAKPSLPPLKPLAMKQQEEYGDSDSDEGDYSDEGDSDEGDSDSEEGDNDSEPAKETLPPAGGLGKLPALPGSVKAL